MRTLPRQFRGDLVVQGSPTHRLVVEPHEFTVRNPHLLEFNRVRYQVIAGSEVMFDGDAGIRGTISTPDLTIKVEQVTDAGEAGSEAIKVDTFEGHLHRRPANGGGRLAKQFRPAHETQGDGHRAVVARSRFFPMNSAPAALPVIRSLLGHGNMDMAVKCFASLRRCHRPAFEFCLYDDGTLTDADRDRLRAELAPVRIVSRD